MTKFEFWLGNTKILELNKQMPVPRIGELVSLVGFKGEGEGWDLGDYRVEDVMYSVADSTVCIYLKTL